jgi:uncharacterized NAD(P)/FAD-binding protein YdhS
MSRPKVAIVGGGASGALAALHLARAGTGPVRLIERERAPGRGVAYSTDRPEHLLNVPARRMSAFADDPDHFVRWFEAFGGDAEAFAPRRIYGDYLAGLLAAEAGVELVRGEAVDVDEGGVTLADGRRIEADTVVLAPGNLAPATPIDTACLGERWVADPWAGDFASGLGDDDDVLLVGTGLTAVDAVLTLEALGFRGRILALSRRGLAPRAHGEREPMVAPQEDLPATCVGLLRRVRLRSREIGWRGAVHELRNVTQAIWRNASETERRRFLRHLRPWWDVHRHKIAPPVAERIAAVEAEGRLEFAAGRITGIDGGIVRWRPRGTDEVREFKAARVLNCTGPECDLARAGEPLLDALLAKGAIRADKLRTGLDVDDDCRVIGADGTASDTLFAIGPITRSAFWESVAVPDIRVQAAQLAERLRSGS